MSVKQPTSLQKNNEKLTTVWNLDGGIMPENAGLHCPLALPMVVFLALT